MQYAHICHTDSTLLCFRTRFLGLHRCTGEAQRSSSLPRQKADFKGGAWVVGGNGLHLGLCVYKVSALLGFTRAEIVFT